MIGGPQGGLILGRASLIEAIRKNPLARALRVDKIALSLLESTLMLFTDEQQAMQEVPTLSLIRRPIGDIDAQARRVADAIAAQSAGMAGGVEVIDGFSQVGSGSLPGHDLPTRLVAIAAPHGDPEQLARQLRQGSPPVFARIAKGQLLIDPRTILPGEEPVLIEAITTAMRDLQSPTCC
jgi:L-seryl-tRNA(Ser) seleniumtransferase